MSAEPGMPGELPDRNASDESLDAVQVDHDEATAENETGALQTIPKRKTPYMAYKRSSKVEEEELAEGLSNEDLWMLIRRFNKQIYYVKATEDTTQSVLDLNRADDEQFPPEKLRMTIERFYTSVVVGVTDLFNHVVRLRSWKEPRRSAAFCGVYFLAWMVDLLSLVSLGTLIGLILFPGLRPLMFPPAPTSQVDPSTGDMKPTEEPGSRDSITGAPEKYKGEAAEQEAKNFVNSIANVAMESAAGKYGQAVKEDTSEPAPEPEIIDTATTAPDAQGETGPIEDKTKQPMKKKVGKATDQIMRIISDVTDVYERFANVLSPTPPFYAISTRLKIVGILFGLAVVASITPSYLIVKGAGFTVGFAFFGDPVFSHTIDYLNTNIPDWKKYLDLQITLLKGIPTNAQLTLTLLRIGELNCSPLPPPPSSQTPDASMPISRKLSKALTLGEETEGEKALASPSTTTLGTTTGTDPSPIDTKPKRRWVYKVLRFVRRTIATAIKSHVALDRAMAIANSTHTKHLIGMLHQKGWVSAPLGPLKFDAKFERKRGTVVIDSSKEPPVLYFTTANSANLHDLRVDEQKKSAVLFQMPVTEIRELKKTEGLGWKGKLIVELTAGSKEAADGLVVSGANEGQMYHVTGMRARNQLFNRLVAIDAQFWESW
ncbi:hypothetical protein P170DRAFT_396493 [Aspergillus steynii IBT 23096]|uniref:Uncharacterized protein n=1 Tax=Aspergillus steynii IBT 23096 TaxID=1392250 RepID=A0A2I2GLQ2_9EURO|nr:uncharacterized protein P170DRAFT_396493 [Aspergillus steynii IBT 23096]PLB53803.1 hypothetical protein P170DRAFT_396493 [Aspergillus steynii IBT 23096]